jgi:nicotinate-nucleotide pyrophosphorylase (carboxylating)
MRKMDGGGIGEDRIRELLREDIGFGDITTAALIDEDQEAKARLYLKEEGVAAGLEVARAIFEVLGCEAELLVADGSRVPAGRTLMEIKGPARSLLKAERTALNIVGRMAGIATSVATVQSVASKANPSLRVAATRKTVPGLRALDKMAVELGGGDAHRFRLDDCVLIKDNHLKLLPSVSEAVRRARERVSFTKKIEVEVRNIEEAVEASEAGADIVMFDNMSPEEISGCLKALEERGLREGRLFEASGGITMDNIADYASSGVDIVSMGSLTHSVRSLDVKLEIEMI